MSLWSRGVDRDRFDPKRRDAEWRRAQGWADDDVVLLFFGRLVLEKGVRDYVATVIRLREGGVKVRPLVVGEGPARAEIEALEGAVLTGHLDGAELARAVASADILLHPSRTEAFGNVVLEAMASGLAVVGADADSARSLVEEGVSGWLWEDQRAAADAIRALVENPERRRALGAAAREASARFSWDEASHSVLDVYAQLVG